jgi:hypothetical protein
VYADPTLEADTNMSDEERPLRLLSLGMISLPCYLRLLDL